MEKRVRPEFLCWQCGGTFGNVIDLAGEPALMLECPYCQAACKVDIAPYRGRVITVMRGEEGGPGAVRYELPETVPTADAEGDQAGKDA